MCLTAVKGGSTSCPQGLVDTFETVTALGIPADTTYQFDGAGSDRREYSTSPGAMAEFLQGVTKAPWAKAFEDSLPILGVDGTLGNNQKGTPAAGHVFAKTGQRVATTAEETGLLTGLTQVGYIEAASGRRLTYGVHDQGHPDPEDRDRLHGQRRPGRVAAAIYSAY